MDMELVSGLLLRPQVQERERYVKHLDRLHELGKDDATGPGWRSLATGASQGQTAAREGLRERSLPRWGRAGRLAGANV